MVTLTVGTRLIFEGSGCEVVGISGTVVTLRWGDGRLGVVDARELCARGVVTAGASSAPPAPVGALLDGLPPRHQEQVIDRLGHVLEVLHGVPDGELSDRDPRPEYAPTRRLRDRQAAKAHELGVSPRTVRRWCDDYDRCGPAALADTRVLKGSQPLGGVDSRWISSCIEVLRAHTTASQPTQQLLLERIEAHVVATHGADVVPIPRREKARRALNELARGTNAFTGSAKGKRSIANRPQGPYGRLVATRPGEYVMLDTTRLDIFAMEPVTLRWVPLDLTVGLDLFSRVVPCVRVTAGSTKAVDVAALLYDMIGGPSRERPLAEFGWQDVVDPPLVPSTLPMICPETILVDHGKVYLSAHARSVCASLGVSIQPGRPYTPTDKAPVERLFRTLRSELLAALPGYKGPDVHSRGHRVEDDAFYFVSEIEEIIRDWIVSVYHRREHGGLIDEQIPGVTYTPLQRLEAGIARAGFLRIPSRPDLALDFLPVEWRTVQHYGVEIDGLRYEGEILVQIANRTSPHGGRHAGKWPFRVDPDNRHRVFFHDPSTGTWHTLRWRDAEHVPQPFSTDVLGYARRIARSQHEIPDTRRALRELLERWDAGHVTNRAERRMWLRMSETSPGIDVSEPLGTVVEVDERSLGALRRWELTDPTLLVGDDDVDDEVDDDFYLGALEADP